MAQLKIILSIIMLTLSCVACGEYEALEIEKKARRTADSLYRANIDSIKNLADTLCEQNFQKFYDMAYDSLKITHLEKAKELINK